MKYAAAMCVIVGSGVAAAETRAPASLPQALAGAWAEESGSACAAASGRLVFDRPAGLRQLTATRWYVDLTTASGRLELDVNSVSKTRLLVATRPLGEARFFVRCGEA